MRSLFVFFNRLGVIYLLVLFQFTACGEKTFLLKIPEELDCIVPSGRFYHREFNQIDFASYFRGKKKVFGCAVVDWSRKFEEKGGANYFTPILILLDESGGRLNFTAIAKSLKKDKKLAPLLFFPPGVREKGGLKLKIFVIDTDEDSLVKNCKLLDNGANCFGLEDLCLFFFQYDLEVKGESLSIRGCRVCTPEVCNDRDDDCDSEGKENNLNPSWMLCPFGKKCMNGRCVVVCPEGFVLCKGRCVKINSRKNCGKCGNSCGEFEECVPQECLSASDDCVPYECKCIEGYEKCKKDKCINVVADPKNCGECNKKCLDKQTCISGKCVSLSSCSGTLCGSECVDLNSNLRHCGRCNHRCMGGKSCIGGQCRCPQGKTACPRGCKGDSCVCIDLNSDPLNCGECGKRCPPGTQCIAGKCVCFSKNFSICSGKCVDLLGDLENCGKCGHRCSPGKLCYKGRCVCANGSKSENCEESHSQMQLCSSDKCSGNGMKCCNGRCIDVLFDNSNCGDCGNKCKNEYICYRGKCLQCPEKNRKGKRKNRCFCRVGDNEQSCLNHCCGKP